MIKLAMIAIDKKIQYLKSQMILQVHDELIFDAHKTEVKELETTVRREMAEAIKMRVPIDVGIGVGPNWLEAK
jgi:DNA polymerase-1